MDKAFDVVLQIEVDATKVAKTSYAGFDDQFRYQCLFCGEEVFLAAVDSIVKAPHFRHRRGNNDKECERYLGEPGAIDHYVFIRRQNSNNIAFYYNWELKVFELGVVFSEEELCFHENENNIMIVSAEKEDVPLQRIPLNREFFFPGQSRFLTISRLSPVYYISFNSGTDFVSYQSEIWTPDRISVFKVRMQDGHARYQGSGKLYTNTRYVAVSEQDEFLQELLLFDQIERHEDVFGFNINNRIFYEVQFTIKRAEISICRFWAELGYDVEQSESFEILWPPTYEKNDCYVSSGDRVYVYSSFELLANRNINMNARIRELLDCVYELNLDDRIHIREKNVECCICKENDSEVVIEREEPEVKYTSRFIVPEELDYFMFDKNGCTPLYCGTSVFLTERDRIVGYKNGHIKALVYSSNERSMDVKDTIEDIIKYHPQAEDFIADEFTDIAVGEEIDSYLEGCYKSGTINTVIKQYIMEGLL